MRRRFTQVDVFTAEPLRGNPVAVVHDADGLSADEMARLANWTNLSETTFVLPPEDPAADYRVRIFTPVQELPFAGHPTLGTAHAWLEAGGRPRADRVVVQECGVGLVELRRGERLAFAAPPLRRSGPVEPELAADIAKVLSVSPGQLVAVEWVDNGGPPWVAALLADAEAVLAARPTFTELDLGLVGFHPERGEAAIEVRAFFPKDGAVVEDPVTGSLNASLAQWLLGSERLTAPYVAAQGTVLGRAGRVHVDQDADGQVWVGGDTVTVVGGELDL